MNTPNSPHDLDAEKALLGAVMLTDVAVKALIVDAGLKAEDFYWPRHGTIWDGMVALAMRGERIDEVTLRAQLGGADSETVKSIELLASACPMAANVLNYARRVIEIAEWRRVMEASFRLGEAAQNLDQEARQEAEGQLARVRHGSSDTYSPEALAHEVWRHLEGHEEPAWGTPWPRLDQAMSGGLRQGEVTILSGWTSHGKSLVTDQILSYCARRGAKVHLYANEMATKTRTLRTLSGMTAISMSRLLQPKTLSGQEHDRVVAALPEIPFGITDVTDWTAADVARDIRFRDWDVCALDLLHRLPFKDEREMAEISSMLNAAAKVAGTHLILVAHLNEARAQSGILPSPVMRDIRNSGMIKNDSDNVMFIHRKEEGDPPERLLEGKLYLTKCRNGELAAVRVMLDEQRLKFNEETHSPRYTG